MVVVATAPTTQLKNATSGSTTIIIGSGDRASYCLSNENEVPVNNVKKCLEYFVFICYWLLLTLAAREFPVAVGLVRRRIKLPTRGEKDQHDFGAC